MPTNAAATREALGTAPCHPGVPSVACAAWHSGGGLQNRSRLRGTRSRQLEGVLHGAQGHLRVRGGCAVPAAVRRDRGRRRPPRFFRPYRERAVRAGQSAYKTAQGAVTESEGGANYYASLSATGLYVVSGYYRPAPDQLARLREGIDDAEAGPAERAVAAARVCRVRDRRRVAQDGTEGLREGPSADRPAADEGHHCRQGLAARGVVQHREGEGPDRRGVARLRHDQRVACEARRAQHLGSPTTRAAGIDDSSGHMRRSIINLARDEVSAQRVIASAQKSSTLPRRASEVSISCGRPTRGEGRSRLRA